MPICLNDHSESSSSITIRPNRSLTRQGMTAFFLGICAVSIAVAVRFWLLGAWVVLPISVLEMLVLGMAFRIVERDTRFCETISINGDAIQVVQKNWKSQEECSFPVYWVQILFKKDPTDWFPNHLYLRSHGRTLEIGACLTDEERLQLKQDLERILEKRRQNDALG